jgi:uncharacterized protein (DUF2249 family)
VINLDSSLIAAVYKLDKNKNIADISQRIIIRGEEYIISDYDPKHDQTNIQIKKPKFKKINDIKTGKSLLYLTTNAGMLKADY